MGKGSSESSTTTQSTSSTTNADQRVAAEGGGVAVGAGAEYNVSYQFPDAVKEFANRLIDFTGGVLSGVNETLRAALASNEAVVNAGFTAGTKQVSEAQQTALAAVSPTTANTNSIMTNLIPIAIIGGIVLVSINLFKKRG